MESRHRDLAQFFNQMPFLSMLQMFRQEGHPVFYSFDLDQSTGPPGTEQAQAQHVQNQVANLQAAHQQHQQYAQPTSSSPQHTCPPGALQQHQHHVDHTENPVAAAGGGAQGYAASEFLGEDGLEDDEV